MVSGAEDAGLLFLAVAIFYLLGVGFMANRFWLGLVALPLVGVSASELFGTVTTDEVKSEFMGSGITRQLGGYSPVRSKMDLTAEIVKVAPEDLKNPKYGQVEFGGEKWSYILDEPEGEDAKLYVDANRDADFTNDAAVEWTGNKQGEFTMYRGGFDIDMPGKGSARVEAYRFDPTDPRRAATKDLLLYYGDFGYKYTLDLDGKSFETVSPGVPTEQTAFWIDRDGNGARSNNYEIARVGAPFNFTGTTYELSVADGKLVINTASEALPEMQLPPDLTLGKTTLSFTATNLDGQEIQFPTSYKGKIVMLDFWATWCGPCIAELPNMKQAYSDWHDQGFEILGISFDQENMEEKLREFMEKEEMPWPQIYEGKGWQTTLGTLHDVSGIPFVLLVDGDTGAIIGTSRQLRGPGLSEYIGKALEAKKGGRP
jgi:thiol-disulfide isomerase/thioredoxin